MLLEVLDKMLQFNPQFRQTAAELLKHRIFNIIRLPIEVEEKDNMSINMNTDEHMQDHEIFNEEESTKNDIDEIAFAKISIIKEYFQIKKIGKPGQSNFHINFFASG